MHAENLRDHAVTHLQQNLLTGRKQKGEKL
jgi:hypothetical protein